MAQAKVEKDGIKVGFFGSAQAGKTELTRALLGKTFSDHYINTMGIAFPKDDSGKLKIAEMGDAARMDGFIPSYAKQFADISVICIDQSDHASLDRAKTYVKQIKEGNPNTKIIIAVTRTDIDPPKITPEEINKFIIDNKIADAPIIRTSAKTGDGVERLLEAIFKPGLEKDKEKITELSSKAGTAIAAIERLRSATYNPDDSVAFQALKTLKSEIDGANNSKAAVHDAIVNFTRQVNEETLKVEPPEVRWQITRFFQALFNWDKSHFNDTQAETDAKARFASQSELKGQLASFKEEAQEVQNEFRLN